MAAGDELNLGVLGSAFFLPLLLSCVYQKLDSAISVVKSTEYRS